MAYAALYGPPRSTAKIPFSMMGMIIRGLGQDDSEDPSDVGLPIIDWSGPEIDPVSAPYDLSDSNDLSPLSPGDISATTVLPLPDTYPPSLMNMYPATVGTEFVTNGDGTYTNIQTGQAVPYSTALAITNATAAPANLSTTAMIPSNNGITLTDPNTGVVYTYDSATGQFAGTNGSTAGLTAAGQALAAAGQLVTAAGSLTAKAQALAAAGGLSVAPAPPTSAYTPIPAPGSLASLETWFGAQTVIGGVPNGVVAVGGAALLMVGLSMMSGKGSKKRR